LGNHTLPYISFVDQEAILNKLTEDIDLSFENCGLMKEGR